jgi:hypothetical protein
MNIYKMIAVMLGIVLGVIGGGMLAAIGAYTLGVYAGVVR